MLWTDLFWGGLTGLNLTNCALYFIIMLVVISYSGWSFSKFIDFFPFLCHGKFHRLRNIILKIIRSIRKIWKGNVDRVLFFFHDLGDSGIAVDLIMFSRLTQLPNRLKNDKSLMMREFCRFLQDKPFVRNTNTTLTWQLLLLFCNKTYMNTNNKLKA